MAIRRFELLRHARPWRLRATSLAFVAMIAVAVSVGGGKRRRGRLHTRRRAGACQGTSARAPAADVRGEDGAGGVAAGAVRVASSRRGAAIAAWAALAQR